MPPRRSSRAPSTNPVSKPPPKAPSKSVPTRSTRTSKRLASPERSPSPPPKRPRNGTTVNGAKKETENAKPTKNGRAQSVLATKKIQPVTAKKLPSKKLLPLPENITPISYFNPLPLPPAHSRPPLQLFVWGAGNFGQFGMGSDLLGEYSKPKKSAWIEEKIAEGAFGDDGAGLEAVAAGGLHTLILDERGTVWSCGVNDDAALGRITKDVPDPNNPGGFLDIDELTAVPYPLQSLIDENFRAVKITAGDSISAAISSDGALRVWGSFRAVEGSLGFADGLKHQFLPTPILDFGHKSGESEKAVSFASGNNHLLVLTTHGNIYAWGAGEQGQLGRRVLERRKIHGTVPEKITLGNRTRKAVLVGAGNYQSFAVDDSGDVWGWGLNTMGQTGTGVSSLANPDSEVQSPRKVIGLSKEDLHGQTVVEIVGGEHHTLFLTSDGKVYSCGRSDGGQLGLPKDHEALKAEDYPNYLPEPTLVPFPDHDDPVVHISAGTHNNMAVTAGGALYAWGAGTQGELGTGDDGEAQTPTMIVRKEGGSWTAVAVACGGQHTLGLFRKKS